MIGRYVLTGVTEEIALQIVKFVYSLDSHCTAAMF